MSDKRASLPPPPQLSDSDPGSLRQGIQWLIDRVYHLDECLDRTQENLESATNDLLKVTAWQTRRDASESDVAAAKAERRRLLGFVYAVGSFVDRNGWKIVGAAAVIYGVIFK